MDQILASRDKIVDLAPGICDPQSAFTDSQVISFLFC